uniref:Uncharacterized protein n=1 Tax=Panagrolaimus sp. ES5 TaxID=591445 RepID=A0AC34G2X1_9BILA
MSLLEFIKETKGSMVPIPEQREESKKKEEPNVKKPTEEDLLKVCRDLWLTVISSCHPQTAEAIENHFKIDNGYKLDQVSASLGFRSTEAFLLSDYVSSMIHPSITKDELDKFGAQRFSAVSYDDINHITDLMSESALTEEEKEARKDYFRIAKYSQLQYQEKAIEMREKLCEVVKEIMSANLTDVAAWDQIQDAYMKKFGQQLNKKHLREAFPTGHPCKIIEIYMSDEFVLVPSDNAISTGNLMLKFRRPYSEILKIFEEAKKAVKNPSQIIKPLEYRTKQNVYVDYVRERTKKDVFYQKKEEREKICDRIEKPVIDFQRCPTPPSMEMIQNIQRSPPSSKDSQESRVKFQTPKERNNSKWANQTNPEPHQRFDHFVEREREEEPIQYLPNPRIIYPRTSRINYNQT